MFIIFKSFSEMGLQTLNEILICGEQELALQCMDIEPPMLVAEVMLINSCMGSKIC